MDELPKTHYSAVVLIPPEGVWEPIQRIRRSNDPQFRRWMPHVTMLFPFVPEAQFAEAAERIAAIARLHAPVKLTSGDFGYFVHTPISATLWLDIVPHEPIVDLQADLEEEFPHCDDVSRFEGGFVPHLSVGKFGGRERAAEALAEFQFGWMPLEFTVGSVALIARSGEPDDPFHVRHVVPLGG